MSEIVYLSEEEFFQWLKIQLEKRESGSGRWKEKDKLKDTLYEILFCEQGLTVEDIEFAFIPFGQGGYLTIRQKFEILLYALEREYGSSLLFFTGVNKDYTMTEDDVNDLYFQWMQEERLFFSDEEKKAFFVQNLMDKLGLGVLEVLARVATDGILVGEFCPSRFGQEKAEERIAICSRGAIIRLPFLSVESKEEMKRIIKYVLLLEKRDELTMIEPIQDFVKEDGTCVTAVRPPAGQDWGLRILYGAARKEVLEWRN